MGQNNSGKFESEEAVWILRTGSEYGYIASKTYSKMTAKASEKAFLWNRWMWYCQILPSRYTFSFDLHYFFVSVSVAENEDVESVWSKSRGLKLIWELFPNRNHFSKQMCDHMFSVFEYGAYPDIRDILKPDTENVSYMRAHGFRFNCRNSSWRN